MNKCIPDVTPKFKSKFKSDGETWSKTYQKDPTIPKVEHGPEANQGTCFADGETLSKTYQGEPATTIRERTPSVARQRASPILYL